MPVSPTYPGIYIEELENPVRAIVGVSTSITAFIGKAPTGKRNIPFMVHSFDEYAAIFGGLSKASNMSYAVYHYFISGGKDAIIIAVEDNAGNYKFQRVALSDYTRDVTTPKIDVFVAKDFGDLGKRTSIEVVKNVQNDPEDKSGETYYSVYVKERFDEPAAADASDPAKYKKAIDDWRKESAVLESYAKVSLKPENPRFIKKVLDDSSKYVTVREGLPIPATNPENLMTGLFSPSSTTTVNSGDPTITSDKVSPTDGSKTGIRALDNVDMFNILCIPPYSKDAGGEQEDVPSGVLIDAVKYCQDKRAILLIDSPKGWNTKKLAVDGYPGIITLAKKNAAIYFPRIKIADPLDEGRKRDFVPCGAIAGIIARTDRDRGVWKAPAGTQATIDVAEGLSVNLTDDENGELNPLGINCLRVKPPYGTLVWGARTMRGNDQFTDQWKYLPVRRLALYIEESLYRGTHWIVFEPNDEPLWSQIRLNVGAFMHDLFLKGAFQGTTPDTAYLVKCDHETTTQTDIDRGIVNIVVGFAPLKPAEFIIIKIQQLAGQSKGGA
jgi:uncharacterized protein